MRVRYLLPIVAAGIVLLALAATGCSSQGSATETPATTEPASSAGGSGWQTVDVQTAYDALSSDEQAQLVDVREPEEWAETGIPQGAVLIPLGDLESRATAELTPDRPVYVICRTGNRSQSGSDILVALGFSDVYNVDGGITQWMADGLPVETYQP